MAHLDEKSIQKLAEAVAVDLVDGDIPLNDSISKLASKMDMNHEQIRRVCEASNNTAFNKIFQKRASDSDDRLVDFKIADPSNILNGQIKAAQVEIDEAPTNLYERRELPDQMHEVRTAATADKVRVRVAGDDGDLQIFSVEKGYWTMPRGIVEDGENKRNAAARILEKATGLRSMAMNLEYAGMESFKGDMYHTFTISKDKLRRIKQPQDERGMKPRIEYRAKAAEFQVRPERKTRPEADIRTLRKTAETLNSTKLAAEMECRDAVFGLREQFRKLYDVEPFEDFEKKAAALYGQDAVEPLNFVRSLMGKTEVAYDHGLLQKHAGLIDDDTTEMKLLKTAIDSNARFQKCDAALTLLKGKIDGPAAA